MGGIADELKKIPPQQLEAEQSLLGGVLIDNEGLSSALEILKGDEFYREAHRTIFRAFLDLFERNEPIDLVTMADFLSEKNQLEAVGGASYLATLVDTVPSASNVGAYAKIVNEKALLRRLIQAGNEIMSWCYSGGKSVEEILDHAESAIFSITENRIKNSYYPIKEIVKKSIETIESFQEVREMVTGVPSHYTDLDRLTAGFQRSDLIIIAGRPSMGKCLAFDSEIVLADGRISSIEEIHRLGQAEILTLNDDLRLGFTRPSAFVDDGVKPVFRVTTRLGRSIETTITHPFLTPKGWQKLSELDAGDRIAVPRKIEVFGTKTLGECESWEKDAHTGAVPSPVFELTRSQLALFLNRLFAADGWAKVSAGGQPQAGYGTANEKFARQVQHLLLRFGVVSTLKQRSTESKDNGKEAWQLEITDSRSLATLVHEIGIFGKEAAILEVSDALAGRSFPTQTESDVYWDEIVSIEAAGSKQVYDLTIPKTHNFVANDICVHNTAFSLNIARNAALESGVPVGYFSLEMSKEQLAMRLLCAEARVDSQKIRTGFLSQQECAKMLTAAGYFMEAPIYIDDTPAISTLELRAKARRMKADRGLGMIVIDYLQLMRGREGTERREQEISEISRSLKALAKELDIPVIALSQLNRKVEERHEKRPLLSDLRESGAIEQDADVIAFIYRDEVYNPQTTDKGIAEISISKQRNGPTGTARLAFINTYTRFENLAHGA